MTYRLLAAILLLLMLWMPVAAIDTKAAQASARAFLAQVDAGKYSQAYKSSAMAIKSAVDEKSFAGPISSTRAKLGAVKSRKLKKATPATELPGAPKGEYVVFEFTTDFANQRGVTEVVTPMKEKDGIWRVAGYYMR